MSTNLLIHEKSPYLLQHAHNPVSWHPWGEEAFRKAREEDKPIFLSVGYSTCHWCHVMERESFEDEEIAELLNRHFVPVKVDREERPDVDRVYMLFVQATTGSGGWPMSVFLTPDLRPFFGGTYFPPQSRYGQPGFRQVLERIAEAWRLERQKILESAGDVIAQLTEHLEAVPATAVLDDTALDSGFYAFRRSFDTKHGGFGGTPKFPRPASLSFMLRYYDQRRNVEALEMVFATLSAMAGGGLHDHVGGGFHRYAVDERWFLPHFEKMLYDQAQLVISYAEAYQASGDEFYAGVARKTLDYVLHDLTSPEGGFYSAEDADSAIDPARPESKGEGAYYVWTNEEIRGILDEPTADWFCHRYGVHERGNVVNDQHGEFAGKNVLYAAHTLEDTAAHFGRPVEEVRAALEESRRKIFEARGKRPRPHLDDKILTSWNGLMISAFARASQALEEPRYLDAARRAASFLLARAFEESGGTLLRRYREGEAAIPGFLDDYAFFAQALLDLYEADFDVRSLEAAIRLTDTQLAKFEDQRSGGFFSTAEGEADLVMRLKDDYDGAEPSGNSIAALNLLRLAQITGRADYRRSAERTIEAFASRALAAPIAMPQLLAALAFSRSETTQIVLAGDKDAVRPFLRRLNRRFLPNKIVLLVDTGESRRLLSRFLPAVESMRPINGSAAAYVCRNYTCQLPATDPEQFEKQLEG